MSNRFKYVMFDDVLSDLPVLFPEHCSHDLMAQRIGLPVLSAGMVEMQSNPEGPGIAAICYGDSISLGVSIRAVDSKIIEKQFRLS